MSNNNVFSHVNSIDQELVAEDADALLSSAYAAAPEGMGLVSSRPNIFGGVDVYDNSTLVSSSRPNIFGGFDVHPRGFAADSQNE